MPSKTKPRIFDAICRLMSPLMAGDYGSQLHGADFCMTLRIKATIGGHVRKGERGTTVVYADRFVPVDEKRRASETGDEAQAIPFLKRFTVYRVVISQAIPPKPSRGGHGGHNGASS